VKPHANPRATGLSSRDYDVGREASAASRADPCWIPHFASVSARLSELRSKPQRIYDPKVAIANLALTCGRRRADFASCAQGDMRMPMDGRCRLLQNRGASRR
jgi:hypothetical protein